jgi:hypothetical protein
MNSSMSRSVLTIPEVRCLSEIPSKLGVALEGHVEQARAISLAGYDEWSMNEIREKCTDLGYFVIRAFLYPHIVNTCMFTVIRMSISAREPSLSLTAFLVKVSGRWRAHTSRRHATAISMHTQKYPA